MNVVYGLLHNNLQCPPPRENPRRLWTDTREDTIDEEVWYTQIGGASRGKSNPSRSACEEPLFASGLTTHGWPVIIR